ncbi:MAG: valine--tRNA ligase [Novosphingobium sp.]|nr:valine--tRNA ligase [Novosphingobium sp.]
MTSPETPAQLAKTFDPAAIEAKWYAHWEANGLFRPERPDAVPFTLVNPPPNVTGSLHIGHALDNTLQDVVVRYERLRGKDALWVVGTDHAGIATQMVVERNLASQGLERTEMGREAFIAHVWEWKAQSGGAITRQLRRLGCSMDWSREQFTMDPHFTRAVVKVFVELYNQGLIYRDKRLVNWDPKLKTAISDLEVETREVQGYFWHIRYPLADGSGAISVATTRPETMLADMAVAVHPSDARYAPLLARGAKVRLPLTGREVPLIADEHADPELGSGAVKITPGHDFNDFEVGKRAGFRASDMLNMLDAEGRIVQTADGLIPDELVGLDRFDARRRVVEMLEQQGLLERVEDRVIATPYGDRGGVVIEPWLTDQWYVDAEKLAGGPIEAVRDGRIEIIPKAWEKTFFNWMENIQPWCISRQLWWGHRIPAWFGPRIDGDKIRYDLGLSNVEVFVADDEIEAEKLALSHYRALGRPIAFLDSPGRLKDVTEPGRDPDYVYLWQETDVLDTWFSSALWPFATLGWPDDKSPLLARHYPNDLLISGFDILFFWDARMAMQGMHLLGDVPWRRLYLHGLVRAADGQKMSKSKGNVVDPLGLIDKYGADALRFFMAAMESQGRDVKMDERRVEGYRNFATKLWNAARFCQANGIGASASLAAPAASLAVNKWIVGEVVETVAELDRAMAELRFDAAANTIYHFVWDRFCDWYLELIKGAIDDETRAVAGWVLDQILVMLHPFMPFVTEELWNALGARECELILAKWPEPRASVDAEAKREVEWIIALLQNVRSIRSELSIAPGLKIFVGTDRRTLSDEEFDRLKTLFVSYGPILARIGKIEVIEFFYTGIRIDLATGLLEDRTEERHTVPGSGRPFGVEEVDFLFGLEGLIDIGAEQARLAKALAASEKERDSLAKRLDNPAFVEKARPEAVDKARADHAAHAAEAERLKAALVRLG